jgi:hypothetical protein
MSLDFNTLESRNPTNQKSHGYVIVFMLLGFTLSLCSVALSLYTIKNIKDPEPVSIQCSPFLLEKIKKQAEILDEIAKTTHTKK